MTAAPPGAMEVDVLVTSDEAPPRRERLAVRGPIVVGRTAQAGLVLEGDLVSRSHAVLEIEPSGVRVEDTSSNGTMAGSAVLRRTSTRVPFGTPIVVGNFTLVIHPAGHAASLPLPPGHAAPNIPFRPPGAAPPAPTRPPPPPPR